MPVVGFDIGFSDRFFQGCDARQTLCLDHQELLFSSMVASGMAARNT